MSITHASVWLKVLVEAVSTPVLLIDQLHKVAMYNAAANTMFNMHMEPTPLLSKLRYGDVVERWLRTGKHDVEWSPDGATLYRPRVERVNSGSDQIGWLLTLQDYTETHRLARSQAEFIRLISHDLRSPLAAAVGFCNILEQPAVGDLTDIQRYYIAKITNALSTLTGLVENIQDAGRFDPDTGFYEMNLTPIDPGDVTRRIVEAYPMPLDKPNLSVQVAVAEDVPVILADHNMIRRAIANLFDNAMKYTPDGGRVEVRVTRDESEVIISVRDNGLGIDVKDQQRLFEKHSRVEREEFKKIKGSGLGLFIVRSVAQQHGGRVWVESTLGEGSTFFIALPVTSVRVS